LYLKTCSINGLKPYCEVYKNLEVVLSWFDAYLQKIQNKSENRKENRKEIRKGVKGRGESIRPSHQNRPGPVSVHPERVPPQPLLLADSPGPPVSCLFFPGTEPRLSPTLFHRPSPLPAQTLAPSARQQPLKNPLWLLSRPPFLYLAKIALSWRNSSSRSAEPAGFPGRFHHRRWAAASPSPPTLSVLL
jgi:hypothetical protein